MAEDQEVENVEQLHDAALETENELLSDALSPPEKEPVEEAPKPPRARDPATGQFVSAAPEPQPEQDAAAQTPPAKPDEEILPSWRAREINEERRRVVAENEAMRAEFARMQAQLARMERAQAPQQAPALPDPLVDPAGYTKQVQEGLRAEFLQQLAHERLNMNLEMTHMRHGEVFEKAYEALIIEGQRGNSQLVRHLTSQANPGNSIVAWYRDMQMRSRVGNDLDAYDKKQRETLLDDDAFYDQMTERRRARALGNGQQPPNTVVQMPPSLTKATGSSAAPEGLDGSENAIFSYAMNSKRR